MTYIVEHFNNGFMSNGPETLFRFGPAGGNMTTVEDWLSESLIFKGKHYTFHDELEVYSSVVRVYWSSPEAYVQARMIWS